MADVMTSEQRKRCMSRIRSKETKPEVVVRKWLFSHGIRYRKNVQGLPGTPDIVITNRRIAVFINGCFWHGHEGCKYFKWTKSNREFWAKKINSNQERDIRNTAELAKNGWHVISIWECDLKDREKETLVALTDAIQKQPILNHVKTNHPISGHIQC